MGKLVLPRKKGESILVGDDIVVKIIGIEGGQIKVLIEAPDEVVILRDELAGKNNCINRLICAWE